MFIVEVKQNNKILQTHTFDDEIRAHRLKQYFNKNLVGWVTTVREDKK